MVRQKLFQGLPLLLRPLRQGFFHLGGDPFLDFWRSPVGDRLGQGFRPQVGSDHGQDQHNDAGEGQKQAPPGAPAEWRSAKWPRSARPIL